MVWIKLDSTPFMNQLADTYVNSAVSTIAVILHRTRKQWWRVWHTPIKRQGMLLAGWEQTLGARERGVAKWFPLLINWGGHTYSTQHHMSDECKSKHMQREESGGGIELGLEGAIAALLFASRIYKNG